MGDMKIDPATRVFVDILSAQAAYDALLREVQRLREELFDATGCLCCDHGYDEESCTCTEDKKRHVGKMREQITCLKKELKEARKAK